MGCSGHCSKLAFFKVHKSPCHVCYRQCLIDYVSNTSPCRLEVSFSCCTTPSTHGKYVRPGQYVNAGLSKEPPVLPAIGTGTVVGPRWCWASLVRIRVQDRGSRCNDFEDRTFRRPGNAGRRPHVAGLRRLQCIAPGRRYVLIAVEGAIPQPVTTNIVLPAVRKVAEEPKKSTKNKANILWIAVSGLTPSATPHCCRAHHH